MNHPQTISPFQRPIWVVFTVLILVSMACSAPGLPGISSTAQSPTPTPTAAAAAAANLPAADTLPPALVETQPAQQGELALPGPITLYFNRPMQPESVEAALKFDPPVQGRFQWLDNASVSFFPNQPFLADTHISASLSTDARSTAGQHLASPVELHFTTPQYLRPVERLPQTSTSGVDPTSAVVVTFNQPVVALTAEAGSQPPAFELSPSAEGRSEWLNTSTYIFYPKIALAGGTQYKVLLNRQLQSTSGSPFSPDSTQVADWSFTTSLPGIARLEPDSETMIDLDESFQITFNQPMQPDSVEQNFVLQDSSGKRVNGAFRWEQDNTVVTFKPAALLARSETYRLVLNGGAQAVGNAALGTAFVQMFNAVGALSVIDTQPAKGNLLELYNGLANMTLTFNAPLAPRQNLKTLIRIEPEIKDLGIRAADDRRSVYLTGSFANSAEYTLRISADLQDQWEGRLENAYEQEFATAPATSALNIPILAYGSGQIFLLPNETSLGALAVNVNQVKSSSAPLSITDFITLSNSTYDDLNNYQPARPQRWNQTLDIQRNRSENVKLKLSPTGGPLPPGLYYFDIKSPELTDRYAQPGAFLMVVSQVNLTLKTTPGGVLVWAADLQTRQPLGNLTIRLFDGNGKALQTAVTDTDGLAQFDVPGNDARQNTFFAAVGEPNDENFSLVSSTWQTNISPWDFNLPYNNRDRQTQAYLYTDRPIYRAGQTVYFRGILRQNNNGRYAPVDLGDVTVKMLGSAAPPSWERAVLMTTSLPLSSFGTLNGAYTLPADVPPGTYAIQLSDLHEELNFEVAEYRKPEIDLSTRFTLQDWLTGEDVQAKINANYYFGAPANRIDVNWYLRAVRDWTYLPDNYQTGKEDNSWLLPYWMTQDMQYGILLGQGSGRTNADGTFALTLPSAEYLNKIDSEIPYRLLLEVTVEDESGSSVSAHAQAALHPDRYLIGVRPDQWNTLAGSEVGFAVRTLDWQLAAAPDQPLTARLLKITWPERQWTFGSDAEEAVQPQISEVASANLKTGPDGSARLAFTPPEPGTYWMEVRGEKAVTQVMLWVGGQGSVPWPSLPDQHLRLTPDQKAYQPGQTANIFIPNPWQSKSLALVTVERSQIMRTMVFEIPDTSYQLKLPLGEEDAPNVYLSVLLLGQQADGRPDFRLGYTELPVSAAAQMLKVDLTAQPPNAQPGSQITLQLKVRDAQDKPVRGEFSLALVDKALLALADPNAPDILTAFYGRQPIGVTNSLPLSIFATRTVPTAAPGRGGGGDNAPAPLRQNFRDLALWEAAILTDANGAAELRTSLPDNLTTWVADLRGVTKETLVGEARTEVVTSKPLMVRPVTPRFLVTGDRVQLAAIVHNNTTNLLTVDVSLQANGMVLEQPEKAAQQVSIPAGERTRVTWWASAQAADTADLIFSARSGNLQDVTRPEMGSLPILQYAAAQTFGTSGVLDEGGKRVEVIGLPRTFTPIGGELRLDISPSLAATLLDSLDALETYPTDLTEAVLSRLLPNLETYQLLKELGLQSPNLESKLQKNIQDSVNRLIRSQNDDGGWGWQKGSPSEGYLTAYVLLGLNRASSTLIIDPELIHRAQTYLSEQQIAPTPATTTEQLDRLAFQEYALLETGGEHDTLVNVLYDARTQLNPWSQALLALSLHQISAADERVRTLLSDLESSAVRTATGAYWQESKPSWLNFHTANTTTAQVLYALAKLDPASPILAEAARYLVASRRADGGWASSYENAWVITALGQVMKGTGELQSNYQFSARLNGALLLNGQTTGANTLTPVSAVAPFTSLRSDASNLLELERTAGGGRMYYRTYLQVQRPVENTPAVQRGLAITRRIYAAGQSCQASACQPVQQTSLNASSGLLVRLTLTVPNDLYYVVVEDHFPAGAEVINPRLKTSQVFDQPVLPLFDARNPFDSGWGWWYFNSPQIYDQRIRWMAESLPAGTYELVYRLSPQQAGQFRIIPAHAWAYYFPEIEASTAGEVFTITETP